MAEPTTARAMAFRVEDMEIEDRVEALEQWGAEQREAGFRAGHAQVHLEPGVESEPHPPRCPTCGVFHHPSLSCTIPEQPSSLVERMKRQLSEPTIEEVQAAAIAIIELAEAVDVLTARFDTVVLMELRSRTERLEGEVATATDVRRQLRDTHRELVAEVAKVRKLAEVTNNLAMQTSGRLKTRGRGRDDA